MASLDASLDDMIKNRRNRDRVSRGQGRPARGRGGGRGGARGGGSFRGAAVGGAPRRNLLGVNTRPSAVTIAKSFRRIKNLPWQNGLFEDSLKAAGMSELVTGTKLYVSNLANGVSNDDIRELFSEIGELKQYAIHFDKNGRPSGSAEVIFARRSDALQAFKKYDNVQLDGKPMKIEIIGAKVETPPVSGRVNVTGGANGRRTVIMGSGPSRPRGGFASSNRGGGFKAANRGSVQRGRGGLSNGRGGGRGRGRGHRGGRGGQGGRWGKNVEKSADELDKELENYHSEAMQT